MNKTKFLQVLSLILCLVLIAAVALTTFGCTDTHTEAPETESVSETSSDTETDTGSETDSESETGTETETAAPDGYTIMGRGNTAFFFHVTDKDGNLTKFYIHTSKTTVGEALLDLGLIEGEVGDYGLYVKKVNGITADYDVDQTYWAFYVDGNYGLSGVDTTEIVAGETYEFRVSK